MFKFPKLFTVSDAKYQQIWNSSESLSHTIGVGSVKESSNEALKQRVTET